MGRLDTGSLLQEISAESPCGEDLEYDPDFGELERAARGKAERVMGDTVVPGEEPDWVDIGNRALELLTRTKDLRVGVYLARAQLHSDGLAGFGDSLGLLRGMLEGYWETVYPLLDAEDDNDPTFRVNTLTTLCDNATVLRPLQEIPLITSRNFGPVAYRDLAIASGGLTPTSGAEMMEPSAINAAFLDCDLEQLKSSCDGAAAAREHADAIEKYVTEQVGAAQAPNLETLRRTLDTIHNALAQRVAARDGGASAHGGNGHDGAGITARAQNVPTVGGTPSRAGGASSSGEIRGRDDVVRTIDRICDYYARHEPSSPVPMLLQRAKRLVHKNFMEIVQDLAPDGLAQAEMLRGAEETAPDSGDGGGAGWGSSDESWNSSDEDWSSSESEETVE